MHIPLGTLQFRDGVEFSFPNHFCCNCAAQDGVRVVVQDTRRTTYLLAGGTETTFQLPLPFCPRCAASAKRRPKNAVHRFLLFALAFALWFGGLVALGLLDVLPRAFADHLAPLTALLALGTVAAAVFMSRPRAGQSSYFQPVRIPKLRQEFVSGAVTAIGFSFANPAYAKAFSQANKEAIARKQLFVVGG